MRVIFRCDSTKSEGLGHVFRCAAVADAALEAGWDAIFCGTVQSAMGRRIIESRGLRLIPPAASAAGMARLSAEMRADVVHVDSYSDAGPLLAALQREGVILSSVEDGEYGRKPATVVIDPSPISELAYRPADGSNRLMRGAKAIPIRRSIASLPAATVSGDGAVNVLVVMGGTDAANMTAQVARLWLTSGVSGTCHIIGQPDAVGAAAREGQYVKFHEPGPDIPTLFPRMDLVVSGAGTTIWELAVLGVPMALIQLAENQRSNYQYAVGAGFAAGLGSVKDGELKVAADAQEILAQLVVDKLRLKTMAAAGRKHIDGRGSSRIVGMWKERLLLGDGMHVREATPDDASMLFDWRNDTSVRSVSRITGALEWDTHVEWLRRSLSDERRKLLIIETWQQPVGTVRFDRLELPQDNQWEVSITVGPAMRGQGRSGEILRAAEHHLESREFQPVLVAEMRESNAASYRLFTTSGYAGGLQAAVDADGQRWYRLCKKTGTTSTDST